MAGTPVIDFHVHVLDEHVFKASTNLAGICGGNAARLLGMS